MPDAPSKTRGGARPGAGRKPGTGPYGEPTQPLRLPVSAVPAVRAWLAARASTAVSRDALTFTPRPIPLPLPLYRLAHRRRFSLARR